VATADEVAQALGSTTEELRRIRGDARRAIVVHYEAQVDERPAEDLLPSTGHHVEDSLLEQEQRGYLAAALAALPERLKVVVVASYLHERRLLEIADELGVTESRVSQMRTQALGLLRQALDTHVDGVPLDLTEPTDAAPGLASRRRAAYVIAAGRGDLRRRLELGAVTVAS
jgi:RNA polymerase sigma factor for flagellar operon FliA